MVRETVMLQSQSDEILLPGDVFVCTTFQPLLINRPLGPYPPAKYSASKRQILDSPSTKSDMVTFVTEFMYSDVSPSSPPVPV